MLKRYLIIILFILSISSAYCAYEDGERNARSRAMGDAIFADFDGVNTMNYNPATIALVRSIQTYGAWDTPYTGLNDDTGINTIHFDLVVPFWNSFTIGPDPFLTKRAALGISVKRLSVSGIDSDGANVEFYHEAEYSLIYAKDLNDALSKGAKISVGVKFNLFDIGIGNTVDVQNNENIVQLSRLSFGMDAGLTYDFSETIHIGLAYNNLVQPNISIMPDGTDVLPSELRLGANWDIGDFLFFKKAKLGFGIISYGRDPNDNRQADMSWNLGYEFRQLTASEIIKGSTFKGEMLAFRFGMIYLQKKTGDDIDLYIVKLTGDLVMTGGLGFTYEFNEAHQVSVDYCIDYGLNNGALRQTVGLSYRYLFPNSAFAYKEEERKELEFEELMQKRQTAVTNQSQNNQYNLPVTQETNKTKTKVK